MYSSDTVKFVIGVLVALLAACLSSLGVNLQASALKAQRDLNDILESDDVVFIQHPAQPADSPLVVESDGVTQMPPHDASYLVQTRWLWTNRHRASTTAFKTIVRSVYIRSQWHLGFGIYLFCQMFGSVIALNFISPVVLAPLGSAGLIFNIGFSSLFIGTRITRFDVYGTACIVAGCAVVSFFGSAAGDTGEQTIDDIINLYSRPAFVAYCSTQAIVIACAFCLIRYLQYSLESIKESVVSRTSPSTHRGSVQHLVVESPTSTEEPIAAISNIDNIETIVAGSSSDPVLNQHRLSHTITASRRRSVQHRYSSDDSPLLEGSSATSKLHLTSIAIYHDELIPLLRESHSVQIRTTRLKKGKLTALLGILYAFVGGAAASDTLLLTKSGLELIIITIVQPTSINQASFAAGILISLILTVILQLYSLNSALHYHHTVVVVPIFYTLFTVLSLTNTMVYSKQFGVVGGGQLTALIGGIAVIVLGVWVLSKSKDSEQQST